MVNCLVQLIGTCSKSQFAAYNSQFAESKFDFTGGFCGILLNRLITTGSGGTAPLTVNQQKRELDC